MCVEWGEVANILVKTACADGEGHSRRTVEAHQRDGIAMLGSVTWQLPEKSRESSQGQTLQLEGGLTPFP